MTSQWGPRRLFCRLPLRLQRLHSIKGQECRLEVTSTVGGLGQKEPLFRNRADRKLPGPAREQNWFPTKWANWQNYWFQGVETSWTSWWTGKLGVDQDPLQYIPYSGDKHSFVCLDVHVDRDTWVTRVLTPELIGRKTIGFNQPTHEAISSMFFSYRIGCRLWDLD